MPTDCALVTGFVPYGGRGRNPAAEIAAALDGRRVAGMAVVGRTLPVSFTEIGRAVDSLLDEVRPCIVLSLGLWPGESVIRIERVGLNLADFEIPDNAGLLASDEPIQGNGATARYASVPVRKIEQALLAAGIPARLSTTAGTFLCNTCLYSFLSAAEARGGEAICGFIHVPYLPEQVAALLGRLKTEARLEAHQRSDMASMDLATSTRAVELALEAAVAELGQR
jgi:pyroglutamyl-peptidase